MRAFIFDMDGTVVDNMGYHQLAWDAMLTDLGISVDCDEFFAWSAGLTNAEILPRLLGGPVSDAEVARHAARKEAHYRELYAPKAETMRGFDAFLQQLIDGEHRLAVGTAAPTCQHRNCAGCAEASRAISCSRGCRRRHARQA